MTLLPEEVPRITWHRGNYKIKLQISQKNKKTIIRILPLFNIINHIEIKYLYLIAICIHIMNVIFDQMLPHFLLSFICVINKTIWKKSYLNIFLNIKFYYSFMSFEDDNIVMNIYNHHI